MARRQTMPNSTWQQLRLRVAMFWISLACFAVVLVLALSDLPRSPAHFLVWWKPLLVLGVAFVLAWRWLKTFPCPRCQHRYFSIGTGVNPMAQRCANCQVVRG